MRKFFLWFGIVMAVIIVAGVVGFFILARDGARADAESRVYVDDAVVAIGRHWDAGELWKRSSADFQRVTKQEDLRAFFEAAAQALGPLTAYRGAQGDATISVVNAHTTVTAKYIARATFEKGEAEFQIAAVKNDGEWRIQGFHINSAALTKRLIGTKS
jgi:hypothetical protein